MSLLAKKIEQITESDLDGLISSRAPESRVLDYKRDTIGNSDKDRYEFLADVSSFANSNGGELIIGIAETDGVPNQICGLNVLNVDQEILRLEQIIRTGIRPLITGIEARAVALKSGKYVIVLRIPKSWAAPHQIGQQGSFRYFGRSSNGKFQLDVDALRSLFRQGPDLAEHIRLFRADRLAKIIANDTPAQLPNGSKIVLHIVPLDNFSTRAPIDLGPIRNDRSILISLLQIKGQISVNLDGYIAQSHSLQTMNRGYVQLFRDASIEVVEFIDRWEVHGHNFLPGQALDEIIQTMISGAKQTYNALNVRAPIAAMLTLLGMEDRLMGTGKQFGYDHDRPFGQKEIVCPEVIIEDLSAASPKLAFPITNFAWNAVGYEQSVFYDKLGNWKGK